MNCKIIHHGVRQRYSKSVSKVHIANIQKPAPGNPAAVDGIWVRLLLTGVQQFIWVLSIAVAFAAASACDVAAQVNSLCSGSPAADCTDVTADGISYTNASGVTEVNLGDGVAGETVISPNKSGIELTRIGVNGANAPAVAAFDTILWDTDNDPDTASVYVVTEDGLTPHLIDGEYIYDNNDDPRTYTIGADTFTGVGLAEFLTATQEDTGATITGSLTVNNNVAVDGPNPLAGAPFSTTNADGILVNSTAGRGGDGGCSTILLYTWCDNGDRGGDAGSVVVNSNSLITVNGDAEGKHGVKAISQGGDGGNGGGAFGLFASDAGSGGNGGNGEAVFVTLGIDSNITTHGAKSHGVFARSRGGNGGSGGEPSGAVALGDKGGNGGDAGNVTVDNDGSILTVGWNSHGIFAQSVGAGAGSGSSAGGIYAEGGNGGGESSGARVNVNNSGTITTQNSDSYSILAQSIGGGGGDGGGAGGWFTVGGRGGSGGNSDTVSVFDSGILQTSGDRSTAVFAQSIGGGGGNGGDAVSIAPTLSIAVGGNGGLGGKGHEVHVSTEGSDIDTGGDDAHGIHAQSIGGGGGNGGLAVSGALPQGSPVNVSVALGGNGGGGGDAGDIVEVVTSSDTDIDTIGSSSCGISAQSIGGGGGNGGSAFAGAGGGTISLAVGIGGKGNVAGAGKDVLVDNAGTVTTGGDLSIGIAAQSIGGGGGNGGFAGTLTVSAVSASVGLGGSGGAGGAAGQVNVINSGTVETGGDNATGIFAQSVGGGGGSGGSALSGSGGILSVSTAVGGSGGGGNSGGFVNVVNEGLIATAGDNSTGVFAQSVGGGGGNGGNAISGSIAGGAAIGVAVGGSGGTGGNGGNVSVTNESTGSIQTAGITSDGVFAQSVGGSGGSGGSATTATIAFPVEIEGVEIPAIAINIAVGGNGGGGGTAGEAKVTNSGGIMTTGFLSNGVFAQSVGGSGGRGGNATNIQVAFDATFTGTVAIGGSGGKGGVGSLVTVDNGGLVHSLGDFSNGIFAQSVGGGGGLGGDATTVSLSLTPPPTAPEDFIPTPSMSFDLAIGGDGGAGAVGGNVDVTNTGTIITEGHFAAGLMAQSVGGSGGAGGDARIISVELSADPMDFIPLLDLTSLDTTLVFGGTGGDGSHGGTVTVTNNSDIGTTGAFAHGIVAQSVGGGGGSGGSAMTFEFSNTDLPVDIPVLDDISGLTTIEMTLQGSGGAGGDGGGVTLESTGNVRTEGDFAMGVVAQSVAGGGGLAGFYNPHGITDNQIVNDIFNTFVDTDAGLSFAGSVGGAGTSGRVIVNHTGSIRTLGDGAHGLFAQSAAGEGAAGNVDITLNGDIYTLGDYAYGIYAQSGGPGGNGDISVTINDGTVMGSSGMGSGLFIAAGDDNSVWNNGLITSEAGISGHAIRATGGDEVIENYGTVTGSVSLGDGVNAFNNRQGATFNTGETVALGAGNLLNNNGTLSPGGSGNAFNTTLTGNLAQSSSGIFEVDVFRDGNHDKLLVSNGTASLNGTLSVKKEIRPYKDGTTYVIIEATGAQGITGKFSRYEMHSSPLLEFNYRQSSDKGLIEVNAPSCSTVATNRVERTIADYLDRIMSTATGDLANLMGKFQSLSLSEFSAAFAGLSPGQYDSSTSTTVDVTQQYTQTLLKRIHSLRLTGETASLIPNLLLTSGEETTLLAYNGSDQSIHQLASSGAEKKGKAAYGLWFNAFAQNGDQDENEGFTGYEYNLHGGTIGFDRIFNERYILGIGIGYSKADLDLDGNQGDGDIESVYGSVYGSYYTEKGYVDAALSYGDQDYENKRRTFTDRTAKSDHDGDAFSAFAEGGYNIDLNKWVLQPFASLQYISLDEEGFEETGAEIISLIVGDRNTESLVSNLGLRLAYAYQEGMVTVIPEVSAAWDYDFDIDDRVIRTAFAGFPNESFSIRGQDVEKHGAIVGIGLTVMNNGGFSTSLKYSGEFREKYQANGVMGELRYEF